MNDEQKLLQLLIAKGGKPFSFYVNGWIMYQRDYFDESLLNYWVMKHWMWTARARYKLYEVKDFQYLVMNIELTFSAN